LTFDDDIGIIGHQKERKKERKMMNKTIQNAVKRIKQAERIAKAYAMPIVNKDMQENDRKVREFFASMKR